MNENEIALFLLISTLILLIFIGGIILFVIQYRNRQRAYHEETENIRKMHQEELLRNQLAIQQQTMKLIGQEIHDNVGQKITLASLYINQLLSLQEIPSMHEVSKILNDSLAELRQLSKSLVQPDVAHRDLIDLLKQEVYQINQLGIPKAVLTTYLPTINLDFTTKHTVFRVVQEFLQNSLKHAHCRLISIQIEELPDAYVLNLQDDGVGFDVNQGSRGIGLTNIKRRITEIGGSVRMSSDLGKGTTLLISVNKPTKPHEI